VMVASEWTPTYNPIIIIIITITIFCFNRGWGPLRVLPSSLLISVTWHSASSTDCCYTSHSRIFHSYDDITIASEGLQNLGLYIDDRRSGSFIIDDPCLITPTTKLVFPVSSEDRPARGMGTYAIPVL
jgi:hypothetical protein